MATVALSTSWNASRHDDGYALLREVADLGFDAVELSHGTRISLVPGILRACQEGWMRFPTLHAFCPLPPGVTGPSPNLFEPTAPDAKERLAWRRYLERTIEFGEKLGSRGVVLHLGSYRFRWWQRNPTRTWPSAVLADENRLSPSWDDRRRGDLEKLAAYRERFWSPLIEGLHAVAAKAEQAGQILCLENREGYDEIPLDADWPELFSRLGSGPWGYWHDTGHAEIKSRLGLLALEPHLRALAPRLTGFHCHDVSAEGRDHQALGEGGVDWGTTRRFWRSGHHFTLELSPRVTRDDVIASRARLQEWTRALPA